MWFEQQINQVRSMSNHYFSQFGNFEKYLNKIQSIRGNTLKGGS